MAQLTPEQMEEARQRLARGRGGSRRGEGKTLSALQQRIQGTTGEGPEGDPTWMGKTADWMTGAGAVPYAGALVGKGIGLKPEGKVLGKTLQKVAPWALKSAKWGLKRSPWGGLGMAALPAALNVGEWGYQKFFDDDPDEAGERIGQAGRTALEEALALGTLGLGRGGLNLIRNLRRGLGEAMPSVTGAGRAATGAADEAAKAAEAAAKGAPDFGQEARAAREAAAGAEDTARTAQARHSADRRARVVRPAVVDSGSVGGTRRRGGPPDFQSRRQHTPGDVKQQGGFDFDPAYQPRQRARWYGENSVEVSRARGLGEIAPVYAKRTGRGTGELLYRKLNEDLQFPPIQRIADPNSPGQLMQRLEQLINVDGITDINTLSSALRIDTVNPQTLNWLRTRLPPEIGKRLTGGGQDPWKELVKLLGPLVGG